ncbi:MAG: YgcG family protein [Cyanothece sp. SIO2G6]|nr:YgcG family protein [Cyanothece sp. SIO2G6]
MLHLTATPAYATGVYDIPPLPSDGTSWIIDDADIISRANAGQLSRKLSTLAQDTGTEVRFVTIRRLDYGETIDSFANQLFEMWFPTTAEQANQVLVVLDSVTNNSTIRTGPSVKEMMADDIAASVANETIQVPLRQGDKYNQALLDASDRLVAVLSGQPDPGPPVVESTINAESTFTSAEDTDQGNATIIVVGFLAAATIIPMVTYYWYVR